MVGGGRPRCTVSHAPCKGPSLGPAWGRAAGALPTLARISSPGIPPALVTLLGEAPSFWSSQDLLALPWAMWSCVCVSAQPAVELHPGRRCQGPGTSTTAQHEPDQPRVSGASEGVGGADSATLLPTGSPALSTQPPLL